MCRNYLRIIRSLIKHGETAIKYLIKRYLIIDIVYYA